MFASSTQVIWATLQQPILFSMLEEFRESDMVNEIKYLDESERELFRATIIDGRIYRSDNTLLNPGNYLFALDENYNLYVYPEFCFPNTAEFEFYSKILQPQDIIKHSSFLAGGDVRGSGFIKVEEGLITQVSNNSGHYTPTMQGFIAALEFFYTCCNQSQHLLFENHDKMLTDKKAYYYYVADIIKNQHDLANLSFINAVDVQPSPAKKSPTKSPTKSPVKPLVSPNKNSNYGYAGEDCSYLDQLRNKKSIVNTHFGKRPAIETKIERVRRNLFTQAEENLKKESTPSGCEALTRGNPA